MARSCLRCHQRKVRCSKTQPCSACLRLGALCRYPPVGAETRRARHPKMTIADRVAQLERRLAGILTTSTTSTTNTINSTNHHNHHQNNNNNNNNDNQTTATTSSDDHDGRRNSNNNNHHDHSINNIHLPSDHRRSLALPAEDHTVQSPTQTDPSTGRTPERSRRHEVLVQDGGSTRYINESFLSQILETERGLHKVIETPRDADDALSSFRPEGLLSLVSRRPGQQQQNQQNQHQHQHQQHLLSRWQATQLWQTYRANVDPVVKILHLPLVEPLVYSTMNGTESDDCTALLYAIYFAAITSLSDADVVNRLGCDKRSCLLDCQARIETALVDAACLDRPSIRCLQALAIYITCLRAHSSSRSGWIINGVLIRSSLAIGLHRDGTHFDLSPLEAELRRRLWWQILMLDYRAAEDHGLAIQGFGSRADTRLPLHVDDSDLSADLLVLPQPHARWTEMTVFLLTTEIAIAFQKLCQTTAVQPAETTTQRLQTVHELSAYLEQTYLRHCNTNIPIQKAGWLSTRSLLAKLEFFVYQQSLSNDQPLEIVSSTAEQTLAAACTCLEQSVELQTDDLLRGFRWLFASYNQFHCLTYILWHLCAQPTGPQVVRAWNIVDLVFELTEGDPSRPDPGPIWNVLRHLRDKAARGRRGETAVSPAQDRGLFEEAADERGTQDFLSAPDGLGDGLAPNLSLDSNSLAEWMDFSESLGIFRFDL